MSDLLNRLKEEAPTYTQAERQIALFLINNPEMIPFETAASIAKRLDISAVTVGRFCRMLGYKHFKELKENFRSSKNLPWLSGDDFQEFLKGNDSEKRRKTLEREIELLVGVYERTQNNNWRDAIATIANSKQVQIIGFQTERGLATLLAHQLQYVRSGIELIEGSSGNFVDILLDSPQDRCLIIIDIRRYSSQSQLLARKAKAQGLAVIMITDTLCDWASKITKHVLTADSDGALFWHSSVPMVGLINLLVNDVVSFNGGQDVEQRLEKISQFYEDFTGFVRNSRNGKA